MSDRPLVPDLMSRREAMLRISATMGGTLFGAGAIISGCASPDARPVDELFDAADVLLLDEIAETILPATDTPGAKAAEVGQFIALMVADTFRAPEQRILLDGLQQMQQDCLARYGASFMEIDAGQRTALLEQIDQEQFSAGGQDRGATHYFLMLKQLTLQGYFTSEIGYTQALRYVETPGRFDPCVPYSVGDRAWADHA